MSKNSSYPGERTPIFGRLEKILYFKVLPAVLIAAAGIFGVDQADRDPGAYSDAWHATFGKEDAREEKIRLALNKALGLEVSVHCVPPWADEGDNRVMGQHPKLFSFELNSIRLQDEVCDDATRNINDYPDFVPKSLRSFKTALAALTISHEAMHVKFDDDTGPQGESITECRAIQTAPAVIKALGSNEAEIQEAVSSLYYATQVAEGKYIPPANCVDGGPYDVYPDQIGGTFPSTPPGAFRPA